MKQSTVAPCLQNPQLTTCINLQLFVFLILAPICWRIQVETDGVRDNLDWRHVPDGPALMGC